VDPRVERRIDGAISTSAGRPALVDLERRYAAGTAGVDAEALVSSGELHTDLVGAALVDLHGVPVRG
jgi:hypothetical protein